MCNPNLLINPDFTNPVNQRGQTVYTEVGYTIDRWHNFYATPATVGNECIILEPNDNYEATFAQKIENGLNLLNGKMITLSIMLEDGTIVSNSGVLNLYYDWQGNDEFLINYDNGTITVKMQQLGLITNPNDLAFVIVSRNKAHSFKKAKLELGSVSTLANEGVAYAAELRKCQRYLQVVRVNDTAAIIGVAHAYDFTGAYISIDTPEKLRITPSVTSDTTNLKLFSEKYTDHYFSIDSITNRDITDTKFVGFAHLTDNLELGKDYFVFLDAGATFTLSAEL